MLTQNELTDIYDGGNGPDDPKPVTVAGFKHNPDMNESTPIQHTSGIDSRDYQGYIKRGVYDYQDVNSLRGQGQSAWDKWGNMVAGGILKLGTSFAENIGYLGSALGAKGDNEDYSNALTDAAKEASAWIDEQFPMYRKNNDTFGLTDAAWWAQNIQNLGVSAAGFAVEGAGFAKLFGLLGKGAEALNLGVKGMKVADKATELLTSGALAYTEGAQMGKEVYDKTYNTQLQNYLKSGMSASDAHEAAKHVAAQSAATTVQLNTMINTGLNLEMLSGLFKNHNEDAIRAFWKESGKQAEGETYDAFAKRIRGTNIMDKDLAKQVFKHEGLKHYAESALSEGIEELTNNFAQATGEDLGQQWDDKKRSGRTLGVLEQLGELSHYFDRTMDANGALSFVLGAVGGVAQGALIDNIPIHQVNKIDPTTGKPLEVKEDGKVKTDDKGNILYQTERVSARKMGKYHDRQYFNNIQKVIGEDLDFIDSTKAKIQKASDTGNHDLADNLSNQLFHAMNFNAVHMGMASNYAQTYREISDTDNTTATRDAMLPQMTQMDEQLSQMEDGPEKAELQKQRAALQDQYDKAPIETEAMKKGYAKDVNDNEYKRKAAEAIETLHALEEIHKKVQAKYQGTNDPTVQDVADIISNRKMSLYVQAQQIKKLQDQINQEDLEQNQMLADVGTVDTHDASVIQYNKDLQRGIEAEARLVQQHNLLVDAKQRLDKNPNDSKAHAVVDNMIRKFSAVGRTDADDNAATDDILDRLRKRIVQTKEYQQSSQDKMFNSSGYAKWLEKNPDKKFDDYTQEVAKKHGLEKQQLAKRAFLDDLKMQHEEATRNLMALESEKGLKTMKHKADALYKEIARQDSEQALKDAAEAVKRARALVASEKNLLRGKHRLQSQYHDELVRLQDHYDKTRQKLGDINQQIQEITGGRIPYFTTEKAQHEWENLVHLKRDLETSLARTEARLTQLQSLYDNVTEDIQKTESFIGGEKPVDVKDVAPDNDVQDNESDTTGQQEEPEEEPEPQPEEETSTENIVNRQTELEKVVNLVPEVDRHLLTPSEWVNKLSHVKDLGHLMNSLRKHEGVTLGGKTEGDGKLNKDSFKRATEFSKTYRAFFKAAKNFINDTNAKYDALEATTPSTEVVPALEQAAKEYHYELSLLPTAVRKKVEAYAQHLLTTRNPLDFDHLMPEIKSGVIDTDDAASVLQALKTYLDTKNALDANIEQEEAAAEQFSQKVEDDMDQNEAGLVPVTSDEEENPFLGEPDSEVTRIQPETVLTDAAFHGNRKRMNIMSINTLGMEYQEYHQANGEIAKMSDIHNLNKNLNPDIQNPAKLQAGTEVFLAIDPDFDGEVNYDYELRTDEFGNRTRRKESSRDFLDEDGKVREGAHSNVPIKIMDAKGKTLGWLARTDWLNAKYPGTDETGEDPEAYRNIVPFYYDEEGNRIDNLAIQNKILHDVRTAIVEAHNSGKGKVATAIIDKGAGMVTFNREVNKNTERQGKIKWEKANKLLPDEGLHMAIVRIDKATGQAYAYSGKGEIFPGDVVTDLKAYAGMPVALLPAPNGQYHAAALAQKPIISKESSEVEFNTLIRAIEIFLGSNATDAATKGLYNKERSDILGNTGFDIATEDGLRDFINQYHTYTKPFRDDVTTMTAPAKENSRMEFVFTVDPRIEGQSHGDVRIGTTFSGRKSLKAALVQGKLDPKFVATLREGIGSRPKNVVLTQSNRRGLNSSGKFKGAKVNSAGVWSFKEYDDYNTYIKDHTTTNIVGTNQLNGKYIYAIHPQIQMDVQKIITKPKVIIEKTSLPDPDAVKPAPAKKESAAERRRKRQFQLVPEAEAKTVTIKNGLELEAKEGFVPVTAETLEKLRNLAGENRNDKTVDEVLDDLQRQQLPFIPEDYNPFSKCK